MTCDVSDQALLLSDFDCWHCVLNDWYLPLNESDEHSFAAGHHSRNTLSLKRASWQRIFDLDWPGPVTDRPILRAAKATQGVAWELTLSQVKNNQLFVAR